MSWWAGVARWGRAYRLDIIWVAFVGINWPRCGCLPASADRSRSWLSG